MTPLGPHVIDPETTGLTRRATLRGAVGALAALVVGGDILGLPPRSSAAAISDWGSAVAADWPALVALPGYTVRVGVDDKLARVVWNDGSADRAGFMAALVSPSRVDVPIVRAAAGLSLNDFMNQAFALRSWLTNRGVTEVRAYPVADAVRQKLSGWGFRPTDPNTPLAGMALTLPGPGKTT